MSNFLPDGTVLPAGLLSGSARSSMAGFNKTYRNTALRIGVIIKTYPVSDDQNRTKLATEYDVSCIEQNEDKGTTNIQYKNCIVMSSLGSIADFFEKTLRQRLTQQYKAGLTRLQQQDGSVVMLLCLDGSSDKAIIIGGFPHPDRPTTLTDDEPQLAGEYNGVNVTIANDGTAVLTWKGPTNNDGSLVNASQAPTIVQIQNDGSFQVNNAKITFRMDASGAVTVTATGPMTVNCADATINSTGKALISATGTATVDAPTINLGKSASDSAILGDTFKKYFDSHTHPTPIGPTGIPTIPQPPNTLSKIVKVQ